MLYQNLCPISSVSWSYDVRGRLVSELRQVGSYGSFASAWGYNSADGLA